MRDMTQEVSKEKQNPESQSLLNRLPVGKMTLDTVPRYRKHYFLQIEAIDR